MISILVKMPYYSPWFNVLAKMDVILKALKRSRVAKISGATELKFSRGVI